VTPVEAYALWQLIENMPESRRTAIRENFAENVATLRAENLFDVYMDRPQSIRQEDALPIARRYFALGLVCPFLTEDACGIYHDRPFVCRQYLVTSPPEMCKNPFDESIRGISMPVRFAHAMLDTSSKFLGVPQATIPLALALEYVDRHRAELERTFPSEPVFRDAITKLSE